MLQLTKQSELDIYKVKESHWFSSWNELEVFITLVRSVNPKRMLEIGVNVGKTARYVLDNVETLEPKGYVGVDAVPGYETIKGVQRPEVPGRGWAGHHVNADHRFRLILKERGSFDLKPEELGTFDVVYIDGDHGRATVEHDTALATQIIRPGGIIIWHDYYTLPEPVPTLDVKAAVDELAKTRPIFHVEDTWLAYERH